jgi:altronate hydrolase
MSGSDQPRIDARTNGQHVHRVAARDDVAIALVDLTAGATESVDGIELRLRDAIPKGHKFALKALSAGDSVLKYGFPIGRASAGIEVGDWVHSHNLQTALTGTVEYRYQPAAMAASKDPSAVAPSPGFMGYRRSDGRTGTRNEIWVLCTVGCVARTAQRIAERANQRFAGRVDGVLALTHPFGCSQLGDDLNRTRQVIASLARHPNAGGVLIVGLGCESLQMSGLLKSLGETDSTRLRYFNAQQSDDELEQGLAAVAELVAVAEQDMRQQCALSELVIGLKCGGSDAFSGMTANPLVGRIADRVAAAGGTPILTEIPEIFGAEHLLMARAENETVFQGVADVVNDFKRYFLDHGQLVHENPSPGNIAGGITTLEEKSLGAVQKGGHSMLTQVLRYGERVGPRGLALLEAPGNDAISSTALVAAGATVLLFTTGRGTPLGFPVPTLKISSNSALAASKPRWIDFDAGCVIDRLTPEQAADELLALVIATASGRRARNEINEEREIALWKSGVTL